MRLLRPVTVLGLVLTVVGATLTASGGEAAWHQVLRYAVAVGALSASAAIFNDLADRERDRNTRLWRPLPAGRVSARQATLATAALLPLAIGFGASLGWRELVIVIAMGAAAGLYSSALRGSFFGWAAFALIGALLPVGAAEAVGAQIDQLWWAVPVGAASGIAAFLIYKLPDYERDDFAGMRSILHWMGIDAALPLSWAALAAALTLAAASVNVSDGNLAWVIAPLVYLLAAGLGCIGMLWMQVSERRLMWQRWLLVPGLAVLLVCWLGAMGG